MQDINIDIRKARIKSCNIEFLENEPRCTITIGLFTNSGKEVSNFTISNTSRCDNKIDLDPDLIIAIKDLLTEFERVATIHCSASIGELPYKIKDL